MEIPGDLALQTKLKWPLHEDDLARVLHSVHGSGGGTEANVATSGYRKMKCANLLYEWKLVPSGKHNWLAKDCSDQLWPSDTAVLSFVEEDMGTDVPQRAKEH